MLRRKCPCPVDRSSVKDPFRRAFRCGAELRPALRLVGARQRRLLLWLIAARATVGFCDLLLAAAMYLLFMLLQGATPAHYRWWTPRTTLSAASVTAALLLLRALMDLVSTR